MIKKELVKSEHVVTKVYCDRCEKERTDYNTRIKTCPICGRDVCRNCSVQHDFYYDMLEPGFSGDYPDYICNVCWKDGQSYREEIQMIRNYAEKEEERALKGWVMKMTEER